MIVRLIEHAYYQVIYRDDLGKKCEMTAQYLGRNHTEEHQFSLRPLGGDCWLRGDQFVTAGQAAKEEPELPRLVR